jgi:L-iditol 2-dehydrogenase
MRREEPMETQNVRQIVFTGPDRVEVVNRPMDPPGDNDVVIRTSVTMISPGTETACLTAQPSGLTYPHTPGYSHTGVIADVGRNVKDFAVGDRVYSQSRHIEYAVLPEDAPSLLRIPDTVSNEAAVFATLAAVALYGVRRAGVTLGDTVAIVGAGLVGLLALKLSVLCGARTVHVLDLRRDRRELAAACGADSVASPADTDASADLTHGEGFDVVLDATGSPNAVRTSLALARIRGRVALLGSPHGPASLDDWFYELDRKDITLIGCHQPNNLLTASTLYAHDQRSERALFLELVAKQKLILSDLPCGRISPDRAPEAYRQIRDPESALLTFLFNWSG